MKEWQPSYVEIHRRFHVDGKMGGEHTFDFVTMPVSRKARTVAIKLLHPSIGPHIQAERFGFLVYDIQGQQAAKWPRLAIVAKGEEWSENALKLVHSLATGGVIVLETDREERIENILPNKMTELTAAA